MVISTQPFSSASRGQCLSSRYSAKGIAAPQLVFIFYFLIVIIIFFLVSSRPNMGLELTPPGSRLTCSTD